MKSFAALATLLSVAQSIAALTINTPTNVVACQPILLTWTDGVAPYYLSVIPGGQVSAPALKTFPTQNGNSLTWVVDLQANTGITITCKDSTGAQAYTDIVTINSGSDTNCLNSNSTSTDVSSGPAATDANSSAPSGTTGVAGATTTGGAAPSAANSNVASATKSTSASTASKTSAGNSASSPTHSNAALKSNIGTFGIAGVMALVGLVVA